MINPKWGFMLTGLQPYIPSSHSGLWFEGLRPNTQRTLFGFAEFPFQKTAFFKIKFRHRQLFGEGRKPDNKIDVFALFDKSIFTNPGRWFFVASCASKIIQRFFRLYAL